MKPLFCFLVCLLSLVSCKDDLDPESNLNEWNLLSIQAFGPIDEFEPGENVWTFDTVNSTVTIESTKDITANDLPEGTYDYTLENEIFQFASGNVTSESFAYNEEGNSLILDAGSAFDAPILRFSK